MYKFSFEHIVYFIVITVITGAIIEYFIRYKLFKWIYFGTLIVIIVNLVKHGNDTEAATEIFKLARI
jgi:hypothetical protein